MSESAKLAKGQCAIKLDGHRFVFRKPTQDEYEDYLEGVQTKQRRGPVYRDLAQRCVEGGDSEFQLVVKAFENNPAAPKRVCDQLTTLAGDELEVEVGKD